MYSLQVPRTVCTLIVSWPASRAKTIRSRPGLALQSSMAQRKVPLPLSSAQARGMVRLSGAHMRRCSCNKSFVRAGMHIVAATTTGLP